MTLFMIIICAYAIFTREMLPGHCLYKDCNYSTCFYIDYIMVAIKWLRPWFSYILFHSSLLFLFFFEIYRPA